MKTSELCRRDAITATEDTTLADVARLMRTHHVGSIVVVASSAERKPVGIVTDRDIVLEAVAAGLDPLTITAGEIMSEAPVVAQADDDVWWALKMMRDRGVRRLPIVDASQRAIGLIALDDVVQHVGSTLTDIAQLIGSERLAETAHRA
jgi:CBS domain-containing protein